MAIKKQITDKNSITKPDASEKTSRPKNSSDFSKTYIELRTVLDALEITALRYSLMKKDDAVRIRRAEKIIKRLLPIVEEYQAELQMGDSGGCCEGFFYCHGVCVPYPCYQGR